MSDAETRRLEADGRRLENWKRWGPYLSERQWGTVREDYSADGEVWEYFPHEHARSRAYRWGEDGLLGICDRECRLCFAISLWNGRDPILKERLFGLSGKQGNHGEDVKEVYFYLDSTPTHSYMKAIYRYPQSEFPYERLLEENRRRGLTDTEFEIADTGVFEGGRYFDVSVEYAKKSPNDILVRIEVWNRGPDEAPLHILPTLWIRNTWSWGRTGEGYFAKGKLSAPADGAILAEHETLGRFRLVTEGAAELLFTENETNRKLLFGTENDGPYVKDAFHDYVVRGRKSALNPGRLGTKAAALYRLTIPGGGRAAARLRLAAEAEMPKQPLAAEFDATLEARRREADQFYASRIPEGTTEDERRIMRQAYAGLLWTKQFYHYSVKDWLEGDPAQPKPPSARARVRNRDWAHLYNRDVLSMPDSWEYPWYAAWDLAFHMLPLARLDPEFAKHQLLLLLREWYMHPNGQIPAYEWELSDVNPPVHAWACWRVYKITAKRGERDRLFLKRAFQKLLLNFTWWVNRKDPDGLNIFSGGFLGMDNIGVFDRSRPLPTGGRLEQSDGTAWMAFYCGTMLSIALELATEDPAYEDLASKFFEHFVAITDAMNTLGGSGLWDEGDGFYYDQIYVDGMKIPLRVRSLVGLIPLIAVEVLEEEAIARLPGFGKRLRWFLENRKDLVRHISYMESGGGGHSHRLLAIPRRERLVRVLEYMLDENEFLSPYGVRSLSRYHRDHPFVFLVGGTEHRVDYSPGEATTPLFGGNSNWRGPIWFPVNYLLIEALERYHHFYGDSLRVACPARSGRLMNLQEVANEIAARLASLFRPDSTGRRPCLDEEAVFAQEPHSRDLLLFHEYFHGETGRGLGACHQTGWTALVTRCIELLAHARRAQPGLAGPRT
ncbi:MAG: glucosidase [Candidatus Eisenbacteria bacterium]|uniref:Glucosidase n=1 Tax=Eiseniibacteriota bacterium TaxID=2212470 RepID=A0A538T4Y2_UNCEI|nr:MAG: glucosidase [Candidatus Eisenbacteria bacterium]